MSTPDEWGERGVRKLRSRFPEPGVTVAGTAAIRHPSRTYRVRIEHDEMRHYLMDERTYRQPLAEGEITVGDPYTYISGDLAVFVDFPD